MIALWNRFPPCTAQGFSLRCSLCVPPAAGKVHPNINLDDPEDAVDTSVLVGPTAQDVDVKVSK